MSTVISGRSPLSATVIRRIVQVVRGRNKNLPQNISVIFTTSSVLKKLNSKYRGHNKSTTILSFILDQTGFMADQVVAGELYVSTSQVRKEAIYIDQNYQAHLKHLITHGLLHLTGLRHSKPLQQRQMEQEEKILAKQITPKSTPAHVIYKY